jgi:putative ABC transport system permease protein
MSMGVLIDTFSQIFRTLWAHKLRSFLTMFGIFWGVLSLLLLVGAGEGFRSGQKKNMAELGENVMFVFGGRAPAVRGSTSSGRDYYLTYKDYLDIKAEAPHVLNATPVNSRGDIRVVSDYGSTNGQVMGVLPVYSSIRYYPVVQGRWINEKDVAERHLVAVVGDEMVKNVFAGRPVVGQSILLNGTEFQVVGVIKRIGRGDNANRNNFAIIPFTTMASYFPPKADFLKNTISYINYQPTERGVHAAAKEEVHKIIARNHGFDWTDKTAFDEWDSVQSSENVAKIFDAMNMFLGGVGLVTLALGAIGVINIMLVSVSERTQEIGLRKALGATYRNILVHFCIEGTLITVISGAIGVAVAIAICIVLGKAFTAPPGFDLPKVVPMSAAVAIAAITLAGVAAGLYPARHAALLSPVEALRKE